MSLVFAMFSFALVMSISPGPVNMITLSSGANYGVRKTLPFVLGAAAGFTLLLLCVWLGFYKVIEQYPFVLRYLAALGSLFIIYMGCLIISSKPELKIESGSRPSFLQGFVLQWLNPKAWMACVAAVSLFSSPDNHYLFIRFLIMYFFVCFASVFSWSVLGDKATTLLNSNNRLKAFNRVMGVLLIATACLLFYLQFSQ